MIKELELKDIKENFDLSDVVDYLCKELGPKIVRNYANECIKITSPEELETIDSLQDKVEKQYNAILKLQCQLDSISKLHHSNITLSDYMKSNERGHGIYFHNFYKDVGNLSKEQRRTLYKALFNAMDIRGELPKGKSPWEF